MPGSPPHEESPSPTRWEQRQCGEVGIRADVLGRGEAGNAEKGRGVRDERKEERARKGIPTCQETMRKWGRQSPTARA